MEGVYVKRQERNQRDKTNPLEVKKMEKQNDIFDKQITSLSQNNDYQKLTAETQKKIAEQTLKNLELTGEGLETQNGLKAFELKMQKSLDELNLGTGVAQDILKILISKLLGR
jgi:hypothetical protein